MLVTTTHRTFALALTALLALVSCQRGGAPDTEPEQSGAEPSQPTPPTSTSEGMAIASESGATLGTEGAWATCGDDCSRVGIDLLSRGELAAATPALALACAAGELGACAAFDVHAPELCATPAAVQKLTTELRCPEVPLHCFIKSEIALHCSGDAGEALAMAESGCSFDDMPSCQQIGEFQMTTLNEPESGVRRFMIACENGYAQGCYRSGIGGLEQPRVFRIDSDVAIELVGRACEMGHPVACAQADELKEAP